jgi:hypothetical protein
VAAAEQLARVAAEGQAGDGRAMADEGLGGLARPEIVGVHLRRMLQKDSERRTGRAPSCPRLPTLRLPHHR